MKKAFTMAEVLITLMILGVIATLTIPALIQNHQKKSTAVAVKKAYSEILQATQKSIADNGSTDGWSANSSMAFFEQYLYPYLQIKSKNSFNDIYPNGWLQVSGKKETELSVVKGYGVVYTLNNGMTYTVNIYIENKKARWTSILVDINGKNPPNKLGRDIFVISAGNTNSNCQIVVPAGTCGTYDGTPIDFNRNNIMAKDNIHNYQCNKNGRGIYCLALIMADGWKIADDYPW